MRSKWNAPASWKTWTDRQTHRIVIVVIVIAFILCIGVVDRGKVQAGHLVLPRTLPLLLCAGVVDQEVQWTGQDTKRIWGHSLSVDAEAGMGIETSSPGHNPAFVS